MKTAIPERSQRFTAALCAQAKTTLAAVDHFLLETDKLSFSSPSDADRRKKELLRLYESLSSHLLHSLSLSDPIAIRLGALLEEADTPKDASLLPHLEQMFSQYEQYRLEACRFLEQTECVRKKAFSAHSAELQELRLKTQAFRNVVLQLQALFSKDNQYADGI